MKARNMPGALMIVLLSMVPLAYAADNIVISEVLYDPTGTDSGYEFVELYNPTSASIDISGWKVQSGGTSWATTATLPSAQFIDPYSYYIIGDNETKIGIQLDFEDDITLQNGGDGQGPSDGVRIVNASNSVIDTLIYDINNVNLPPGEGIPAPDVIEGHSLERKPGYLSPTCGNSQDTNNNSNDFIDNANPNPQNSLDSEEPCIAECVANEDCSDGLYCNGVETCAVGQCQAGTPVSCAGNNTAEINTCANNPDNNPFTRDFRQAFTSACNEAADSCAAGPTAVTSTCNKATCGAECEQATQAADCSDGNSTTVDTCLSNCTCINTAQAPEICNNNIDDDGDSATDCYDSNCIGQTNSNGKECCSIGADCSDSLYCNGVETCSASKECQAGATIDCSGSNIAGINACANNPDNNPFTWDFRQAFTSECNEATNSCDIGNSTISYTCSIAACGAGCEQDSDCPADYKCNLANCSCYYAAVPICGDNIKNRQEELCDGSDLNGKTCQDYGYANGQGLSCKTDCSEFIITGCAAVCGNGAKEPGEECDDNNLINGDGCSSACENEAVDDLQVNYARGRITIDGQNAPAGTHYKVEVTSGENNGSIYERVVDENIPAFLLGNGYFDTLDHVIFSTGSSFKITSDNCADSYEGMFQNGGNGDFISQPINLICAVPPVIHSVYHTPASPVETNNVTILANVTDNVGVSSVSVNYTINSTQKYSALMALSSIYSVNLGKFAGGSSITYRIIAKDTSSNEVVSGIYPAYINYSDNDGDGVFDKDDNCVNNSNSNQTDSDTDGMGNVCDACSNDANNDIDNDLVCTGSGFSLPMIDDEDNCPDTANADQANNDANLGDMLGDVCDPDDDNDSHNDADDDFPLDSNRWLFGDLNGDDSINILDWIAIRNRVGAKPGDSSWNGEYDLNGDGEINLLDFIILRNNI